MQQKKLTTEQLRLVDSCIDLAYMMANKYAEKNRTMDRCDLEQEAMLGLIEASVRYDPGKGTKFTTYCYPWIMKFCLAYVERNISRGFKPEKKRVEQFLYQRMSPEESNEFVDTFIKLCGFEHVSHRGDGSAPIEEYGSEDQHEFVDEDWLRSVASVADRILSDEEKVVFTEVLACIADGSDTPIVDAARNVRMRAEDVREISARAFGRVVSWDADARAGKDADDCGCW